MLDQPTTSTTLLPLGTEGEYSTRQRVAVADVTGRPVASLGLVPAVMASRFMAHLRHAVPLSFDQRIEAIARAGELFATDRIGDLDIDTHENLVSRVGGLPIGVVRASTQTMVQRMSSIALGIGNARPHGTILEARHMRADAAFAVWARRGNVLSIHAAGNHPGTHTIWPEALALGYRVAVRPSKREPFTPYRLVAALRRAGFGDDQVILLPTESEAAEAMLRGADLSYGGDEIIRKHASAANVLSLRPGRSKILVTSDVDWRDRVDTIVDSICHHGGTGCVNATAVFVEGDPRPLAKEIAARLSSLPSLPPEDTEAILPVQSLVSAKQLAGYVNERATGTQCLLGGRDLICDLGDGSAVLRPCVHLLDAPDAPQAGLELPFPCVWVAPWSRADGIAPLRETLVLTAMTNDDRLIEDLIDEPTIRNVYVGNHATCWTGPGMPHDGYLAEFLMSAKAVLRH